MDDKFPNYAPKGVPAVIKHPQKKPEFNFDCLTQIDGVDPLAPRSIEFDWEVLRRNLREAREELSETDFALVADVLKELLRWIVKGTKLKTIGLRAVALAWVVNPDIFNGASASTLSKVFGCSNREQLSYLTSDVSVNFKVRNRSQAHGANFKPDGVKKGPGRKTRSAGPGIKRRSSRPSRPRRA